MLNKLNIYNWLVLNAIKDQSIDNANSRISTYNFDFKAIFWLFTINKVSMYLAF